MPLQSSAPVEIGSLAPPFRLPDASSGEERSLEQLRGSAGTVIMFICNHCPYVKHVNATLVRLANEFRKKGVSFVAISSNDIKRFPEDAPEFMKKVAADQRYPFPYLFDQTQDVARAYHAECTPDIFAYDASLKLKYHGQVDDTRPGSKPSTGEDLHRALNFLIEDKPFLGVQKPGVGCSIKWK